MKFMHATRERILIVLPAYNEECSLEATLNELKVVVPNIDFLVIDDGSKDKTTAIALSSGALVATLPINLGVGGAMRLGYKYAVQNDYDVVVQIDADGQHDPADLPLLVESLKTADLVIGARFAGLGSYKVSGPRKWAMVFLAKVISHTANTTLTDTTSGFRASNAKAIQLFASDYPAEYLGDTVESLVTAIRSGLTVKQIPVVMRPRQAGSPSQNAWRSTGFLIRAIFALMIAYIRPKHRTGATQ